MNALPRRWTWYPDFYCKGDSAIVLDAKYKRLDDGIDKIEASDQHQIVSYMYILKARLGGFVYPFPDIRINDDVKVEDEALVGLGGMVAKLGIPIFTDATKYPEFVQRMGKVESQFHKTLLDETAKVQKAL